MAFESNKFSVAKKIKLPTSDFSVECNVSLGCEVDKILSVGVKAYDESSETLNGVLNYSSVVDLKIIFITPEGEINSTCHSCNFSSKFESSDILSGQEPIIVLKVVDYSIESISSDSLKVVVNLNQSGVCLGQREISSIGCNDEEVCCKNEEIEVVKFVGSKKETFDVESETVLRENIKKVLTTESQVMLKSVESGTGFVSLQGDVLTRILYLTEEDKFDCFYINESFKQEIEIDGVEKDYINALEWYRKAADQNDSTAQNSVGLCYYIGIGVKQNYVEAVKWYRKAANQQNSAAQNNLGWCYQEGLGLEKDCNEAVKWYRRAAENGNSVAQDNLGDSYYIGRGDRQNYKEAAKWYRMAAEQGNRTAQNSLGNCYYYGNGVEQNYIEAVRWYRQAAEQGLCNAQNNLANCYFNGKGIIQDYVEAVKWYRMAAEQGYSNAQNNLGYCYYNGKGVIRDYAESIKWYRKAASRGSESAKRMLERLGE